MERLVDRTIGACQFTASAQDDLPQRARIVIVGGGIVGSSIAHHLAALGERDVLLLDSNTLGSGTSWHAAGLANRARATHVLTQLSEYGTSMFQQLEALTGIDVNWNHSGSLALARTPGRCDELHYQRNVAIQSDIAADILSAEDITKLWPLLNPAGVSLGLHIPDDGHVNPGHAATAFAKLAHDQGVSIRENTRVNEVIVDDGRVTGVRTNVGDIDAEVVVLAAGLWSRDLGRTAGAALPLYAAEHVHVRTHPIDGASPSLPVLRDLDHHYYARHENGRFLIGAFEPKGLPRRVSEIATDGFAEFDANWGHFRSIRTLAEAAIPDVGPAGYDRFLNAPESFTPDANFLLGETNEVDGLFVAAGFNSQGITYAPGVGRELAAWITSRSPQFDASTVDVTRFSRHQASRRYLHERTREGLGRVYSTHWPLLQMTSARNVRRTPLHSRLEELGAAFGEANGLERANWYERPDEKREIEYSFRRPSWFDNVAREHQAVRENVGIFDLSPFSKFEISGPDALSVVQWIFTANLDIPLNQAVYTLALNRSGGVALDCTVTRLEADRFFVVAPSTTQDKTLAILRRAAKGTASSVVDVTAGLATILIAGPRARDLMETAAPTEDWSDEAHRYQTGREIEIAGGFAYSLRVSFVGELGYELYVPSDLAVNVFDSLWSVGTRFDATLAGYYALDSLRVEKGFRHLGHDMGPNDNPRSAGLWFTIDLNGADFIGRDAVKDLTPKSRVHRTVYVRVEDPLPMLWHDETLFRDNEPVGLILSGAFGHTFGSAVGLAAIDPEADDKSGTWEIECGALGRFPLTVSRRPFYDPAGARMKG